MYERAGGQTTLVSTGPTGGNGAFEASFEGASADGSAGLLHDRRVAGGRRHRHRPDDVYVKRIAAPVNTARPTISGTPLVGRRLSCAPGQWANNPTTFAYRWNRNGTAINRATSRTYTLTAADGARTITCTVTASNGGGSRSATSASVIAQVPGGVRQPPDRRRRS